MFIRRRRTAVKLVSSLLPAGGLMAAGIAESLASLCHSFLSFRLEISQRATAAKTAEPGRLTGRVRSRPDRVRASFYGPFGPPSA